MLGRPPLAAVNHLLAGEDWARARLAGFAGQTASFEIGRKSLRVSILESGLLVVAAPDSLVSVNVALPEDAVVRLLIDRESVFSAARISGSVDLAETFAFVFRHLRWDAEHDLAQVLGDVAARRAVRLAKALLSWQSSSRRRLVASLAEYLGAEDGALAQRSAVERFCSEVDVLRDDLARLEKRLQRAESCRPGT